MITRVVTGLWGGRRAGSFAGKGAAPTVIGLTLAGLVFASGAPQASARNQLSAASLVFAAQTIGQRLLVTFSTASLTFSAWQITLVGAIDLRPRWKTIQSTVRGVFATGEENDAERHKK